MTRDKTRRKSFHNAELWNWHDIYNKSVSYSRVVTRSQTAFNRIVIKDVEFDLFTNPERHQPPNLPHLMVIMKDGTYGAIPRTIITRSTSKLLRISPVLSKTIEEYKTFYPMIHARKLTHGHDDPGRQALDDKVFQRTESQPFDRMDEDEKDQFPPELPKGHGHRIVSTPPEVLRESLASMRFCYDDEQLIPDSVITSTSSTAPESNSSNASSLLESFETHQKSLEKDEKPLETDQEPIGTDQEHMEIDQEPIETHQESFENIQEPLETDQESIETDQEPIETHQETFETIQESLEMESTPTSATDSSPIDGTNERSTSKPKTPVNPVKFLHDLLGNMEERPMDDHLYKDNKDDENEKNE